MDEISSLKELLIKTAGRCVFDKEFVQYFTESASSSAHPPGLAHQSLVTNFVKSEPINDRNGQFIKSEPINDRNVQFVKSEPVNDQNGQFRSNPYLSSPDVNRLPSNDTPSSCEMSTLKIWVPSEQCGKLIGQGGSHIKEIREQHAVYRFCVQSKDLEVDGCRILEARSTNLPGVINCINSCFDLLVKRVWGPPFEIKLTLYQKEMLECVQKTRPSIDGVCLSICSDPDRGDLIVITGNELESTRNAFKVLFTMALIND